MIRPYANKAAELAMRQARKLKPSSEQSREPDSKDGPHRGKRDQHSRFSNSRHQQHNHGQQHHGQHPHGNHKHHFGQHPHGPYKHQQSHGQYPETQIVKQAKNEESVNEELARGESIDSVESADDLSNKQAQTPVGNPATQNWVRLQNPLASYFPDLKTDEELRYETISDDSNDANSANSDSGEYSDHCEPEYTPWWQQDRSYFHDYRYNNWGASAFREMNLESLREAADAMWFDSENRPAPTPAPRPTPVPEQSLLASEEADQSSTDPTEQN